MDDETGRDALLEFWSCVWFYVAAKNNPIETQRRVWAMIYATKHPLSKSGSIRATAASLECSNSHLRNLIADAKLSTGLLSSN